MSKTSVIIGGGVEVLLDDSGMSVRVLSLDDIAKTIQKRRARSDNRCLIYDIHGKELLYVNKGQEVNIYA